MPVINSIAGRKVEGSGPIGSPRSIRSLAAPDDTHHVQIVIRMLGRRRLGRPEEPAESQGMPHDSLETRQLEIERSAIRIKMIRSHQQEQIKNDWRTCRTFLTGDMILKKNRPATAEKVTTMISRLSCSERN